MAAEEGPFIFRINENGSGPNLLVQVCSERGWREYSEGAAMRDNWNLWWRTNGFPASTYKSLKMWQFTNHIPKGSSICRKDTLARYLRCMRKVYGSVYDFSPSVYNLPLEYNKLVAEYSRSRTSGLDEEDVWICKPVGLSQGRGIYLFRRLSELTYDSNTIVQRYIRNPLLIGGYKFDLRLYVCVPCYRPLTVYLYREGLVRFSTDKFSLNDLDNPFCHLTNCSLNKMGPGYLEKKERVGSGCKWTLKQLRRYFAQTGQEDWLLWQRVSAIVVLTILTQMPFIPSSTNCFEFLGFDILVDAAMRPWLLEVNLSPALGNDCDVDPAVKKPMLHDLFDLLGMPVCNTGLSLFTIWDPPQQQQQQHAAAVAAAQGGRAPTSCGSSRAGEGAHGREAAQGRAAGGRRGARDSALAVVTAASRWRRHHQQRTARAAVLDDDEDDDTAEDDRSSSGGRSPTGRRQWPADLSAASGRRGTGPPPRRLRRRSGRRGISAPDTPASLAPAPPQQPPRAVAHTAPTLCVTALRAAQPPSPPQPRYHGRRRPAPSPPPTLEPRAPASALRVTPLRLGSPRLDPPCSRAGGAAASALCEAASFASSARTRSACRKRPPGGCRTPEEPWCKPATPLLMDRQRPRGVRTRARFPPPTLWGNGKDWRAPSAGEGDWVRVYPLCAIDAVAPQSATSGSSGSSGAGLGSGEGPIGAVGDPEVRRAVAEINRMLRVAREVARKYAAGTDIDRSKALADHMCINGEVWLPHK